MTEENSSRLCKEHSGVLVRIEHLEEVQTQVNTKLNKISNRLTAFLISVILLLVTMIGYVSYGVVL